MSQFNRNFAKKSRLYIEHRKNFRNGEIVTDFSGTIENQKVNITKKDKKRGHIRSHSKFDINENTYLDLKLRVTDRNYLNTYRYKNTDILETLFKLATHQNRNFYSLESYAMQDLRANITKAAKPKYFLSSLI